MTSRRIAAVTVTDQRLLRAAVLAALLLSCLSCEAYAGPGAGFAVLSSFWTLFIAFLYSLYAFFAWPFRQLFRLLRRSKRRSAAGPKRVVIVGFDGMDPVLTERFMSEGRMPHLARLRDQGSFHKLQTTYPAITPVAWSSFMTGVNPGKHNIFDFLARDPHTYLPVLSSAEVLGPKHTLRLGKFQIPLGGARVRGMRRGIPFWHWLSKAGIFCSIIRVPLTFPPEKFGGVLLSGMCVPDLKGSQGTFCLCTTKPLGHGFREGGVRVPFERRAAAYRSYVPGPEAPGGGAGAAGELKVFFELTAAKDQSQQALFRVESQEFTLRVGEYSEWIPVKFGAGIGLKAHGICRFYLKELHPEVEVYVTPVNIDPSQPALPLSHPAAYSIYLAKLFGPYATLGLAEDTWALNEHVLDDDAFLEQCYANHAERELMLFDALEKTRSGVCACVFDTTDRVQHMFWRYLQADHPALRHAAPHQHDQIIQDLYARMDALVGRVMEKLEDDALLMVLSDHGFTSFARCVNLNAWLHNNGYLVLKPGKAESGDWFEDVDWSRTRAYTMGLNGVYLNVKGRERDGIVKEGAEANDLKQELQRKLEGLQDPLSGDVSITGVFDRDAVYSGPYTENSPDLLVGYAHGYRASWDSVMGKVTTDVFEDNTKPWSGDHCVDPRLVPGVLFSNRSILDEAPAIVDVAPTLLKLYGLELPMNLDGRAWTFATDQKVAS